MRPIDADALIEKCGDWYVEEGTESGFIGTLKNLLATMPTIQPEPTEGYWIDKGIFTNGLGISWYCFECSKCHSQKTSTSNYCPNCGAKMKGEANE